VSPSTPPASGKFVDGASPSEGLRLHLGCGGVLLDGYRNIDLPPSEHGVQEGIQPDEYADITQLSYPPESVEEIRLHHVFEHFDRPTAIRLLIDWREFLRPGGTLRIETPDFKRCAQVFVVRRSPAARMKLLRHMFGSHEAGWAVHKDGWYEERFRSHLEALGYEDLDFERSHWRGTFNITVKARRGAEPLTRDTLLGRAEDLLRQSLVDEGTSELDILGVWMQSVRGD
jgi:predicted SAM-dependent methyltransferase